MLSSDECWNEGFNDLYVSCMQNLMSVRAPDSHGKTRTSSRAAQTSSRCEVFYAGTPEVIVSLGHRTGSSQGIPFNLPVDMSKLSIYATIRAKPGKEAALRSALEKVAAESRKEPGVEVYIRE